MLCIYIYCDLDLQGYKLRPLEGEKQMIDHMEVLYKAELFKTVVLEMYLKYRYRECGDCK
jgi:hypothetical protein